MSDPQLTPDQEARVRRLLADARHRDPMPPELVARLDGVLAELAAGSTAETEPAPSSVVSLDTRRRRRWGAALVAAAAVTVLGVGLSELTDGVGSMSTSDSGADSAGMAENESGAEEEAVPDATQGQGELEGSAPTEDPERDAADASKTARRLAAQAQEIRSDTFRRDVRRLAALTPVSASKADALLLACDGADAWGPGDVLPATYSGQLGALVYRTPTSDGQQVELFLCGVDGPVRSVTLPVPDVAP